MMTVQRQKTFMTRYWELLERLGHGDADAARSAREALEWLLPGIISELLRLSLGKNDSEAKGAFGYNVGEHW